MIIDLKAELILGEMFGAPKEMRVHRNMERGGFMEMLLTQKASTNKKANFFQVCLFTQTKRGVKEVQDTNYKRAIVPRNQDGWRAYRARESSVVMINFKPITFPQFKSNVIIHLAGVCDHTGKLLCFGKLRNLFLGKGVVGFHSGSLIIRLP